MPEPARISPFSRLHDSGCRARRSMARPWMRFALAGAVMAVAGCSAPSAPQHPATTAPVGASVEVPVLWNARSARRQVNFIRINLPAVVTGMRIDVGTPTGPGAWIAESAPVALYSSRILRGSVTGPAVDQLTGYPGTPSDQGSYMIPLKADAGGAAATSAVSHFVVREPMPVYMKLVVSALQEPGEYRFPVTITLPGRAPEQASLAVVVSDVALPTDPRVLAVATTSLDALTRLFPAAFNGANKYLDRADPDQQRAVETLDALVKTAQHNGVSLCVEDLGPQVRVDEVGRVTLKWDAYDRLMQPYMDGSAFEDRVPLTAWLAPLPPRRISDSPTQLRQYVAECAKHFTDKGWVATPAFLHPALVAPDGSPEAADREEVSKMVRLHMTRDMLAVTTPAAHVPQPRLWVVEDSDPRLPPAGAMATEDSVREWPLMCAARSTGGVQEPVKGFVWRDAIAGAAELEARTVPGARPLFVVTRPASNGSTVADTIAPSLRMVWLEAGLNDAAMVGLLEQRADAAVVQELYAGIVGRTGLTTDAVPVDDGIAPVPPGYLYAGWPSDRATWDAMPAMLEKLVLASDPGSQGKLSGSDPLYMATKLWLANTRRPAARVAGHALNLQHGREGDILEWKLHLLVENPVNATALMESRFALLPGDLDVAAQLGAPSGRHSVEVPPFGVQPLTLPITGHLDMIDRSPAPSLLEISERNGGALMQLPIGVPMFRMKATESPLKIDGEASDWPSDPATRAYGEMSVGMHYLSRPNFLTGTARSDAAPAIVRWTYDRDYLYMLAECPQTTVADERNNDWPVQEHRWWGTDGVQVQVAAMGLEGAPATRIVQLGFKPGGAMLTRVAEVRSGQPLHWMEGEPGGGGAVRYGTAVEKNDGRVTGYQVEAAIPRKWFEGDIGGKPVSGASPAWRVNVLRHRASDLTSMSWTGPVVNDEDIGLMGLLIGKP